MITVIIPSYNRAHLLAKIIPTYLQKNVSKIILIDDASTDNTTDVVKDIQQTISQLEYVRLENNSKQVFAKNVGIDLVETDWIYFGDDDSVLFPGSLEKLLNTCKENDADICGGKALYQDKEEDIVDFVKRNDIITKSSDIANIKNLTAKFNYSVKEPIAVNFTHASALVKTELAKKIKFDTNYIGNCYREETDFFIRCKLAGAKLFYNSDAVQINLPRKLATGGSHSSGKLKWYYYTIINNHYFMKKNWKKIRTNFNNVQLGFIVEFKFVITLLFSAVSNITNRILK